MAVTGPLPLCQPALTGRDDKSDLQLLPQCGSTCNCQYRSGPEVNFVWHCGVKQHWIKQSSLRILRQVLCGGGDSGRGGYGDGSDFRRGDSGHSCRWW